MNLLYDAILSLRNRQEVQDFLTDLCTYKEVEAMSSRLYSAKLLSEGATYLQAVEQSGLSSATVSRVSRCLQIGTGYNTILKRKKEKDLLD